jgi:hypothetical protein
MHRRGGQIVGEFGRFEQLRSEMLRPLERTGTPITSKVKRYLDQGPALNAASHAPYRKYYDRELRDLVGRQDAYILDRFGYRY